MLHIIYLYIIKNKFIFNFIDCIGKTNQIFNDMIIWQKFSYLDKIKEVEKYL